MALKKSPCFISKFLKAKEFGGKCPCCGKVLTEDNFADWDLHHRYSFHKERDCINFPKAFHMNPNKIVMKDGKICYSCIRFAWHKEWKVIEPALNNGILICGPCHRKGEKGKLSKHLIKEYFPEVWSEHCLQLDLGFDTPMICQEFSFGI